ncbi:hypothetical protein PCA10_09970 [Metapseudomonas resinovorans NBRC 106553]|uniref:Uncharacterized protein n=1 Tax=Metapseudomonas resinovorans NBRC 106553 TaxID=1245471 RepID=S6BCE9_METRE|nr:hypothetical protein PCA10_09970 [Pseudomonas resinovorans NBRC 106553]
MAGRAHGVGANSFAKQAAGLPVAPGQALTAPHPDPLPEGEGGPTNQPRQASNPNGSSMEWLGWVNQRGPLAVM